MKKEIIRAKQCSDLCEHCVYLEEGDFYCTIAKRITITHWEPQPCMCPKGVKNNASNKRLGKNQIL